MKDNYVTALHLPSRLPDLIIPAVDNRYYQVSIWIKESLFKIHCHNAKYVNEMSLFISDHKELLNAHQYIEELAANIEEKCEIRSQVCFNYLAEQILLA